jgi:HEAT repeat protein
MKERSARVEERLGEIREDFAHRQLGAVNPPPNKREMPTMAARNRTPVQDEEHTDFGDEDPQEMEELKHTLLTDPDPEERIGAVLMLTGEEGPESLRMLLEAMDDPDPEVRLAVVEALGDRAEDLSPDTLTIALQDPDAEVRFEAVSILGDMETPEALEMVRIALGDKDDDVRALAEGILDFADEDDDDLEELTPGTSRQQKQNQAAAQR